MRDRLEALNDELERTRGLRIGTRTGITTGPVAGRGDDLVAGDTSYVASSVQGAAEPGEVLLAEPTYRLVEKSIEAEQLPRSSSSEAPTRSPRTGCSRCPGRRLGLP